jgi:hypothetical protein
MKKVLIHIADKKKATRVVEILKTFKLEPKVVHWQVKHKNNGEMVPPPNLGIFVPDNDLESLAARLSMMQIEMLTLEDDPVLVFAVDKDKVQDKYVVVAGMPPKNRSVAIIDTENSEFVTSIDMQGLDHDGDNPVGEEVLTHLRFVAAEFNRFHTEIQTLLDAGPLRIS